MHVCSQAFSKAALPSSREDLTAAEKKLVEEFEVTYASRISKIIIDKLLVALAKKREVRYVFSHPF